MEVEHRGALQLAFFTTSLLSFVGNGFPGENIKSNGYVPLPDSPEKTEVVLWTLNATAKAVILQDRDPCPARMSRSDG